MGKTSATLLSAGFTITRKYPGARWFQVISPDCEAGAVLCQSQSCWHFFARDVAYTASHRSADRCHLGGLGDALAADSQMRTYERLLDESNVPKGLLKFHGVFAALSQVPH